MLNLFRNPFKRNTGACFFILASVFLTAVSCSTKSTPSYQLITSSVPAEGGSVSPASGEHDEGAEVQVQASANENWIFDGWEGDQTGSQNPVTVMMDTDKTINARFIKREYPLTINYEGEGSVTESIVQTKMTDYEHGTIVELEAISDAGYDFARWSGDLESTENPVTITVDGPKEVTVVFEPMEFNVQVSADGAGTASVDPKKEVYMYNETVTFTAVPTGDAQFIGWFNESGSFEMLQPIFDHQILSDLDITAFFRTVENAFVVETVSISTTDGKVDRVVFNVSNYLLDDIALIGADLDNEEGEEFSKLRFGSPPTLPARSAIEVQVTFEGDLVPDEETIKEWVFTWLFDFEGERYEKEQEVGEPASNAKQKPSKSKDLKTSKSIHLNIK